MIHLFWAYSYGLTEDRLRLYFDDFCLVPVDLPPVHEQRRIAEILSTWDRAIETVQALIANARQQKAALMQALLTGKRRLPGFDDRWVDRPFSKTFRVVNDKSTQVQKSEYADTGRVPIVDQGQDFIAGFTNNDHAYSDVPVIVFGDHTRVVKWVDFEFCPGADGTQLLKGADGVDDRFAYHVLAAVELPQLGYSRHMRELRLRKFSIPSRQEQERIAELLSRWEGVVGKAEAQLTALRQEKAALMQQLLTGKRRGMAAESEAA